MYIVLRALLRKSVARVNSSRLFETVTTAIGRSQFIWRGVPDALASHSKYRSLAWCTMRKGKVSLAFDTRVGSRSWSRLRRQPAAYTGNVVTHKSGGDVASTFWEARGYLPSRRASSPFGHCQIILLGDVCVCEQFARVVTWKWNDWEWQSTP